MSEQSGGKSTTSDGGNANPNTQNKKRTNFTNTQRENKKIAEDEYLEFREKLNQVITDLRAIEKKLENIDLPYIKGKDENWKEE